MRFAAVGRFLFFFILIVIIVVVVVVIGGRGRDVLGHGALEQRSYFGLGVFGEMTVFGRGGVVLSLRLPLPFFVGIVRRFV